MRTAQAKRDDWPAALREENRFKHRAVLDQEKAFQHGFTPPDWCTYYDKQVPKCYDAIERETKAGKGRPLEYILVFQF